MTQSLVKASPSATKNQIQKIQSSRVLHMVQSDRKPQNAISKKNTMPVGSFATVTDRNSHVSKAASASQRNEVKMISDH